MLPTTTDLSTLILPEEANPIAIIQVLNVRPEDYDKLPEEKKKLYVFDEETDRYNIPDDVWANQIRSGAICGAWPTTGGSSTAPLMDHYGVTERLVLYAGQTGSEYSTTLDRFYEEMGLEFPMDEEDDGKDDIFFIGHVEEESCRQYFKRYFEKDHPGDKVKVINDTTCYQYQGYKHWKMAEHLKGILANVDGIIEITCTDGITRRGILECKTSRFNTEVAKKFAEGVVPFKYYIQLVVYMAVMNLSFAYICLKTGINETDFTYIYVERNFDAEKLVLKAIDEFFTACENDEAPSLEGETSENILKYYRKMSGPIKEDAPIVELPEEYATIAVKLQDISVRLADIANIKKELEAKRIEYLNEILPMVGESTYATVSRDDEYYYALKFKNTSKALDEEKLKAEKPEIYEMYLQEQPKKFNTTLFNKEQKPLKEKYETFKYKKGGLTEAKMNFCEVELKKKATTKSA